jgi:hypothetical protein
MHRSAFVPAIIGGLFFLALVGRAHEAAGQGGPRTQPSASGVSLDPCFDTPSYVTYRALSEIEVDGRLDDAAWAPAPWTSDFVDMAGRDRSSPQSRTRARLLWDDEALYIAAELEEAHVWATLSDRDSRIYLDNAFEVFIDPDGDTHHYYELEVNALGTIWDLMLLKPYRDGGTLISAWDIRGIEVGVHVDGTLNDPTDTDDGWNVEFALPWSVLAEAAPEARPPRSGEQWRLNFSRSHWSLTAEDGAYRKLPDTPANWSVWSPQGEINIHKPECWGFVEFAEIVAGEGTPEAVDDSDEPVRRALRLLYYRQRDHLEEHGRYADDLEALGSGELGVEGMRFEPVLRTTQSTYEITSPGAGGTTIHIRQDGKVWTSGE